MDNQNALLMTQSTFPPKLLVAATNRQSARKSIPKSNLFLPENWKFCKKTWGKFLFGICFFFGKCLDSDVSLKPITERRYKLSRNHHYNTSE